MHNSVGQGGKAGQIGCAGTTLIGAGLLGLKLQPLINMAAISTAKVRKFITGLLIKLSPFGFDGSAVSFRQQLGAERGSFGAGDGFEMGGGLCLFRCFPFRSLGFGGEDRRLNGLLRSKLSHYYPPVH